MIGGVLLTIAAAKFDSRAWLFMVAVAAVTFVLFYYAMGA
jgi:hypothetical protein